MLTTAAITETIATTKISLTFIFYGINNFSNLNDFHKLENIFFRCENSFQSPDFTSLKQIKMRLEKVEIAFALYRRIYQISIEYDDNFNLDLT